MKSYLELLKKVLYQGEPKKDRTGTGTYSLFGPQLELDIRTSFPLMTTKRIHWKSVVHELLWFISGDTNIGYLQENGVRIWDEWADENGNLGPVYGEQWRQWDYTKYKGNEEWVFGSVDQLQNAINSIKETPDSRRIIVNSWNVGDLDEMALPPCHLLYQFYVDNNHLSCKMYQRSADIFLGVPFNIASYALLTYMVAQVTNLTPDKLILSFGDIHLYKNHIEQAKLQLSRKPKESPVVSLNSKVTNIDNFKFEDIELRNYDPHPIIKAKVAV